MSRTLFENSKAALAFAAVTLVGAVSMVGTSDNNGILPTVVQKFGTKPQGQAGAGQGASASEVAAPDAAATPKSVFGEYDGTTPSGPLPSAPSVSGGNPMTAPMAPTAMVDDTPNPGLFSSGSDEPAPPPPEE